MTKEIGKLIEVGRIYRIWVDGTKVQGEVLEITPDAILVRLTTFIQRNRTIWVNLALISTIGELT